MELCFYYSFFRNGTDIFELLGQADNSTGFVLTAVIDIPVAGQPQQ
jgi:hypothetical protein